MSRHRRAHQRVARRIVRCSNPTAYIWCEGQVRPGGFFYVLTETSNGTARTVAFLCPACYAQGAR